MKSQRKSGTDPLGPHESFGKDFRFHLNCIGKPLESFRQGVMGPELTFERRTLATV